MIGSIIGDIVGSIYEFDNIKTKDFPFWGEDVNYTDDSVLTIATAEWLINGGMPGEYYLKYAQRYPHPMGGYGQGFGTWISQSEPNSLAQPYNSCGNGSAMRISPVGWVCTTEEDVLAKAKESAECTHNHPEGIKGAQATAMAIFLARKGVPKENIRRKIESEFHYDLSMNVETLRDLYSWQGIDGRDGATCQGTVPEAMICAFEANDFEDAIRNAVSIGGDSDTLACITGCIAEALYGVPRIIYEKGLSYLDDALRQIVLRFEEKFGANIIEEYNHNTNVSNPVKFNDMCIEVKINEIIDQRIGRNDYKGKGHLDVIQRKKKFFEDLQKVVEEYQIMRAGMLDQISKKQGEYYKMSIEDPSFLQKVEMANPASVIPQLQKCLNECEHLEKRFNRETINISVVGRAGQGKSRLLQSISGVEDDIIPADKGGDCTGAKSTIANADSELYAQIKFYSQQEIVAQINDYLDNINASNLHVGSIIEIPNIPLEAIHPETARQHSLLDHLTKYVEHYDEYSQNLGTERQVSDKAMIRRYVAQYATGNPNVPYYAYLGVKEVTIYTRFPTSDIGKIMLVDTIGLGDTSLNLEEKMLDTLANDSDAAIVVRKTDSQRDHISDEDDRLYELLQKALGNSGMEYWLFYVINSCQFLDNIATGELLERLVLKKKERKAWNFAQLSRIDCASETDVRNKLLLPMLEFLSSNLKNVDNKLMDKANVVFSECYQVFYDFCGNVNSVLSSNFQQAIKTGGLFDRLYEDELGLPQKLEELNMQYADHKKECLDIQNEITSVIGDLKKLVPKKDTIKERLLKATKAAHVESVYNTISDELRAAISDKFEEINRSTIVRLQEDVKRQIIEVLQSEDGGKLSSIPIKLDDDSCSPNEWLEAFIGQQLGDYPLVKAAFESILNYRLNIEGLLEYRVNMSIEHLDPEDSKFERLDFEKDDSLDFKEQKAIFAEEIRQALLRTLPVIKEKLYDNIGDILVIPYNSFYARIKKLRDRIIYSKEGERELKEMYREAAPYIWHERFAAAVSKQVALESLGNISKQLSDNRSKALFTIKLEKLTQ